MKKICFYILWFFPLCTWAQFDPPAGWTGSKALYKDSSIFVAWANACDLKRGWQNIADTSIGKTTVGDSNSIIGIADNDVISLGDRGTITLMFGSPIYNGPGPDFAVFENSFNDTYLELAFVEVSSDGSNYYRFAAVSNSDTAAQYDNAAEMDATKLYNLAGKYKGRYGTPFDLEELKNLPNLNINAIKYIRLTDVVGSLKDSFCSRDSKGQKINDPWPTPFPSSGFDLDAVGVIHDLDHTGVSSLKGGYDITVYPNPAQNYLYINSGQICTSSEIVDMTGKSTMLSCFQNGREVDISSLENGVYMIKLMMNTQVYYIKFVKQ